MWTSASIPRCQSRTAGEPVRLGPGGRRDEELGVYEGDIEAVLLDERRIQGKVAELAARISQDYEGRDVLLVGVLKGAVILMEDIVDSGLTLDYLVETLHPRRPASLEVCVLLTKPEELQTDLKVRYKGFDIPSAFVVGYGLDYAERYRNLPFVATLRPEVYQAGEPG